MWTEIIWAAVIIAVGLLAAMTVTDILYERRTKRTPEETELCEADTWVIDNTVDFLAKTIDQYPLKEGESRREALFFQAQGIARDRLIKAGFKINDYNNPLIDDRILQRIHEIGVDTHKNNTERRGEGEGLQMVEKKEKKVEKRY